jgi:hypothetical protein
VFGVDHRGTWWDEQQLISPLATVPQRALPGLTLGGPKHALVGVRGQTVHPDPGFQDDARTISAVPSVGTPAWDVLLASEAGATVPTFACAQLNQDAIDKHTSYSFQGMEAEIGKCG